MTLSTARTMRLGVTFVQQINLLIKKLNLLTESITFCCIGYPVVSRYLAEIALSQDFFIDWICTN